MKRTLGLFIILGTAWAALVAQPVVDGNFLVMTNNGTTYSVKVQLKTNTGTDDLGTATIQFDFNSSALSFPEFPTAGVDYVIHAFSGGNYSVATVTRPLANRISINIELNVDNAGTVVGTSFTDVATIDFSTTNPASNSNLTWGLLELYDGDNSNLWTSGSFPDENTTPLPVQMASFTASSGRSRARLEWSTNTEKNNHGFDIERRLLENAGGEWVKVGFVAGSGTKSTSTNYSFEDKSVVPARYAYRLRQIDSDGTYSYSMTAEVEVGAAEKVLSLSDNFPNPFNPSTMIEFTVPSDGQASLKIYNAIG